MEALKPFRPRVFFDAVNMCVLGKQPSDSPHQYDRISWNLASSPSASLALGIFLREQGVQLAVIPDLSLFNREIFPLGITEQGLAKQDLPGDAGIPFLRLAADGVILQRKSIFPSACVMVTRDCPTVIIHNGATGEFAVCHVGRDSLIPPKNYLEGASEPNVIENALQHLLRFREASSQVLGAYIACGIGDTSFTHSFTKGDGSRNEKLIRYVCEHYGEGAVSSERGDYTAGRLSLRKIITAQLMLAGINWRRIEADSIDTYSDPRFHSRRRDGAEERGNNLVIVWSNH